MRLQRAMCDFAVEHSFAAATQRLREHYGFELGASAFREVTLENARRARQKVEAEYAKSFRELPASAPGTILAEADGSMLCTVPAGLARDAKRPRQWQEMRLLAAQKQGRAQTFYAATFGEVQAVGQRWGHVARQAGRALESPIQVLCDGAEWIAIEARATFGEDASILTDFYHVSEYLAAAAPSCQPESPGHWRQARQSELKTGGSEAVIALLAAHREPEATPEDQAPVRAAHRYLSNRRDTLDYAAALAAERPIGSGLIESAHKHVLQKRLKISGAAWLPESIEDIAQLRILRANGRWDELWPLAA